MILDYFFGTPNKLPTNMEFKTCLPERLSGFYGWSPYFRYVLQEGKLRWGNSDIKKLKCESFSINNNDQKEISNKVIIRLDINEYLYFTNLILEKLELGPLIFWVPMAESFSYILGTRNWNNIIEKRNNYFTIIVPWNLTHCVVIVGFNDGYFIIHDCSIHKGNLKVNSINFILNVLAMNIHPMIRKLREIENNRFHLLVYK